MVVKIRVDWRRGRRVGRSRVTAAIHENCSLLKVLNEAKPSKVSLSLMDNLSVPFKAYLFHYIFVYIELNESNLLCVSIP